jgi:hypothetical protein
MPNGEETELPPGKYTMECPFPSVP